MCDFVPRIARRKRLERVEFTRFGPLGVVVSQIEDRVIERPTTTVVEFAALNVSASCRFFQTSASKNVAVNYGVLRPDFARNSDVRRNPTGLRNYPRGLAVGAARRNNGGSCQKCETRREFA